MPRKPKDWRSRPRKPAAARRSESIYARVTAGELRRVQQCARAAGLGVSDYLRSLLPIEGPAGGGDGSGS